MSGRRSGRRGPEEEAMRVLRPRVMELLQAQSYLSDGELREMIDQEIFAYSRGEYLPLEAREKLGRRLFDSFRRLDILQELVDDPEVTEIMVNGKDCIFLERKGVTERWDRRFETSEQLEDMIQQIVSRVNRMVNTASPIVDARLEDGSRVHIVLPPVALNGPIVTIRKFPEPITIPRLIKLGAVTPEAVEFLGKLVASGYNIFISGGTNSGKSTFLNALSALIPPQERIITIEDSAELQIQQIENLVRLETRNANSEGEGAVTMRDLLKAALRMNPDRIIVGEVRGGEALEMLQVMNTGHDGSMSTGHGNNPADMLSRLETMVLTAAEIPLPAVRSQISSAIDILIHLGRLRDRSRRVLMIAEIGGVENGEISVNPLFQFQEKEGGRTGRPGHFGERVEGTLRRVGILRNTEKLAAAGYPV